MLNKKLKRGGSFMMQDDPNPMDGVSNMSDAMLVLAVGIMLALVINWKIDIGQYSSRDVVINDEMQEINVEDPNVSNQVSLDDFDSEYIETGKVYKDVVTGKTYIVIDK